MNFLDKVIRKAQTLPFENTFCMALTEYIVRKGALGWDEDRKLFWVLPPSGKPEVAVWLVDVTPKEVYNDRPSAQTLFESTISRFPNIMERLKDD